jgi:nucleoside-diphosphate-sugar epimerase
VSHTRSVVTGAAGFIGSHLAEHLLTLGHDVVGIDCITSSYAPQLKRANSAALLAEPRFRLVDADLTTTVAPCSTVRWPHEGYLTRPSDL